MYCIMLCVWCNEKKKIEVLLCKFNKQSNNRVLGILFGGMNDFKCVCACVHYSEVRELNGQMKTIIHQRTIYIRLSLCVYVRIFCILLCIRLCEYIILNMKYTFLFIKWHYWSIWLNVFFFFFFFCKYVSMCVRFNLAVAVVFTFSTLIAFIKKWKILSCLIERWYKVV